MSKAKLAVVGLLLSLVVAAQIPFRAKKATLHRALPPVVELEAKSFTIEAIAQDRGAAAIATSFKERFRAKIQGDDRFVYTESNPALRVVITITRFYVEPKRLTTQDGKGGCETHTGSLQGTFQIIDTASRRAVASDVMGWKIQTGRTKHWLVADDGREMNIHGPNEKFSLSEVWSFQPDGGGGGGSNPLSKIPGIRGHAPHPCDQPLTQNEARDALSDAFMTEILQLSTPYTLDLEVPVPSNKAISGGVEEAVAQEWSRALDQGLAAKELPKLEDESERLFLMGLANEALGYKQGERAFDVNKKIQSRLAPDELARQQTELRRIVDLAKEHFDKASDFYSQANRKKSEEEYRAGERRADQSRRLYARIQKYREMRSVPVQAPPPAQMIPTAAPAPRPAQTKSGPSPAPANPPAAAPGKLTMTQVLAMCTQGLDGRIIAARVANAPGVAFTINQFDGEFAQKCKTQQYLIFEAFEKRGGK